MRYPGAGAHSPGARSLLASRPLRDPAEASVREARGGHRGRVDVRGQAPRTLLLAAIALAVFTGLSYRLYLARYHTEVGLEGMASWWFYIFENAERLARGEGLFSAMYAPGQSWATYLISEIFYLDVAVLRVTFGLLDGIAIVFVYLLASEMSGRVAGLCAAWLYALWPEGASASINILHDHSPQPLFLFAGLWLLLVWQRTQRRRFLALAGILLGVPPLFRTDSVMVAPLAALALLVVFLISRTPLRSAAASLALFLSATLLPSLPYDLFLYSKYGTFTHIAAADAGATVFLRYGRNSGAAGARHADTEVAFVSGEGQALGYGFWDHRRVGILSSFGRRMLAANPGGYARMVIRDSWPQLSTPAGYGLWWSAQLATLADLPAAIPLRNPEWPLAILTAMSRIQYLLVSRVAVLALAVAGLATALWRSWQRVLPLGVVFLGWILVQSMSLPVSRYVVMPLCLAFVFIPVPAAWMLARLNSLVSRRS